MPASTPRIDTGRSAPTGSGGGGTTVERVTVNLNRRASRALEDVVETVGSTKTDAINRALILYQELSELVANGGKVFVQEKGGKQQGLLIL
jgi:hypothetical protein